MERKKLFQLVEYLKKEVDKEINDRLPRKVGIMAKNFFTQNFRDGGWRDGSVYPWQKTKRQAGKTTDAKYSPLTSRRNHLMRSIEFYTGVGEVTVQNPVPYARIHNDGGEIHSQPTITPKMRNMAWAKVYSIAGVKKKGRLPKELPEEALKWRNLALTKKKQLNIKARIPKRQFMGENAELGRMIEEEIGKSLKKIKDGIATARFD